MPFSSSVTSTCCLFRLTAEVLKTFLTITCIVIEVIDSLVMVVLSWYVNIHLYLLAAVTVVSFDSFCRSLKQFEGNLSEA